MLSVSTGETRPLNKSTECNSEKDCYIWRNKKTITMSKKDAIKLARESIYDNVQYIGKWNGFDVYEPIFEEDIVHHIGFPKFILEKDDTMRWTTGAKEACTIMDALLPDEPDD